ncbi:uncharacterized protein DUF2783 [Litoreibacter halocynthiae]|uniref:Uncharacterized protein DUF2783 n=1 Tax=Litoreibacter halocynthiae TaxID=1242689 RepID=A0A4R7LQE5_9RHOB|nr:DUF2783 domain-containing protein [Litoreibacter halocynthiae]TDT77146.1 uncharacterized protein DUF2783 [Litoreibacter halocynthiae]
MSTLNLKANIDRPDDFYEALLNAHDGMSKTQSDAFNARLILILANHIGDREVLNEALAKAAE